MSKLLLASALLLGAGCAAERAILERGWIGGEYEAFPGPFSFDLRDPAHSRELPEEIARDRTGAVLVTRVFDSTPAEAAGLHEGDLVLESGDLPVESAGEFLDGIDALAPGSKLKLKLYRFGETVDCEVIVGRERYQTWRRLMLKLFPFLTCDLYPNPDFDIFGLLSFWSGDARLELREPRQRIAASEGRGGRTGDRWGFFLGIFGLASYREVLSQEK
jgi:hypothetical protein